MTKTITLAQYDEVHAKLRDECGEDWDTAINANELKGDNEITADLFHHNREEFQRRIKGLVDAITQPCVATVSALENLHGEGVALDEGENGAPAFSVIIPVVDTVKTVAQYTPALVGGLSDTVDALAAKGCVAIAISKHVTENGFKEPTILWRVQGLDVGLAGQSINEQGGDYSLPAYVHSLGGGGQSQPNGLEDILRALAS